jgi:predicted site-specific integrase-resolvase
MEKVYNVTQFAEMIGKSVKTMQKWDRDGILKAYRSPSNRRYYTHTQYMEYMGLSDKTNKVNVIYARVSTRNQADDLSNQIEFLKAYTLQHGIEISNLYTDYGSGMNYNRPKWNTLIDDCFEGKISTIIISHKDRFVRFGFDWISDLLERLTGVKIVVVENIATTPEKELINDLISIIHVFSCRVYGLRKYKRKLEKNRDEL